MRATTGESTGEIATTRRARLLAQASRSCQPTAIASPDQSPDLGAIVAMIDLGANPRAMAVWTLSRTESVLFVVIVLALVAILMS
jgi:hypothetical protein